MLMEGGTLYAHVDLSAAVFLAWLFNAADPAVGAVAIRGVAALSFALVSGFAALDAQWRMRDKRLSILNGGRK